MAIRYVEGFEDTERGNNIIFPFRLVAAAGGLPPIVPRSCYSVVLRLSQYCPISLYWLHRSVYERSIACTRFITTTVYIMLCTLQDV